MTNVARAFAPLLAAVIAAGCRAPSRREAATSTTPLPASTGAADRPLQDSTEGGHLDPPEPSPPASCRARYLSDVLAFVQWLPDVQAQVRWMRSRGLTEDVVVQAYGRRQCPASSPSRSCEWAIGVWGAHSITTYRVDPQRKRVVDVQGQAYEAWCDSVRESYGPWWPPGRTCAEAAQRAAEPISLVAAECDAEVP